ncbi:hypothetical protein ME783_17680 [Lactobacillus delbrueckii]|uniref:hypothetical protein n=1 Tax=Lactobacillus delbrueckii TaxID=1584 RepID=UPI001F482DA8|nr:hypothetical protein [Lactobacillus delbrueckii]GHN19226.1 hypothetical protein ME783_17680 [Lactobacillus delbrueckii]
MKKPKKILQLRLEDKNVFNAIHLNSIGYVFEFGQFDYQELGKVVGDHEEDEVKKKPPAAVKYQRLAVINF